MSGEVLYLHVSADGGLLLVDGGEGLSRWVTEHELVRQLHRLRDEDGTLLLSHDGLSAVTTPVVELVRSAGLRVVDAAEVHPDARRPGGATSAMAFAHLGALELLADALERGANLEAVDEDGYTALMYAADGAQPEAVAMLVRAGAAVDRADHEGSTR